MKNVLACTDELMHWDGGDMHLLHVTFTPPVSRHPSQAIVRSCCLGYAPNFWQGETVRPTLVLRNSITGMSFLAIRDFTLVMK
jgi:hypothetical protein